MNAPFLDDALLLVEKVEIGPCWTIITGSNQSFPKIVGIGLFLHGLTIGFAKSDNTFDSSLFLEIMSVVFHHLLDWVAKELGFVGDMGFGFVGNHSFASKMDKGTTLVAQTVNRRLSLLDTLGCFGGRPKDSRLGGTPIADPGELLFGSGGNRAGVGTGATVDLFSLALGVLSTFGNVAGRLWVDDVFLELMGLGGMLLRCGFNNLPIFTMLGVLPVPARLFGLFLLVRPGHGVFLPVEQTKSVIESANGQSKVSEERNNLP